LQILDRIEQHRGEQAALGLALRQVAEAADQRLE
jgi:hypothetical protein